MEEEEPITKPYRPELDNVEFQNLTFFNHPENCPYHPRTLYFSYDSTLNENENENNKLNRNLKLQHIKIKDKKFMVFYKAYENIPLCLSKTMNINNIIQSRLLCDTNIIWKLFEKEEIYELLEELNKYQKYNHFPNTWFLTEKDTLYKHFKKMKNKFPNEYNYMPETYIIPENFEELKKILLNYKYSKDNMWLIKPLSDSSGRGVKFLQNINTLPSSDCLVTKYISNPYLINNKKFDLRLYFLITGYTPLKMYLFDNGLIRLCTEDYNLNENELNNNFIHLTNYSINKNSKNYVNNNNKQSENEKEGNKWSLQTFIKYLNEKEIDFKPIWEKIKDILIKTVLSVTDESIPLIKCFNLSSCNLFELYGVDILLDSQLNPWLLEINLNPSLNSDSELDLVIKSKIITDIFNIVGVIPFTHDEKFNLIDQPCLYKDKVDEAIQESLCEFCRPSGGFELIFPLKENIDIYKKFICRAQEENLALWDKLKGI